MELSTIITGLVAVVLIFGPFYLLAKSGGKQKKKLARQFDALCSRLGLTVTESDLWNDMAFGIDSGKRQLIFYKNRLGLETHTLIDLDSVVSCKKINISRNVSSKGGSANVIDVLGLEFSLKQGMAPVMIEFYNSNYSFVMNDELQMIEKWSVKLNGLLKKEKVAA